MSLLNFSVPIFNQLLIRLISLIKYKIYTVANIKHYTWDITEIYHFDKYRKLFKIIFHFV